MVEEIGTQLTVFLIGHAFSKLLLLNNYYFSESEYQKINYNSNEK
jgi:hypothetical protein